MESTRTPSLLARVTPLSTPSASFSGKLIRKVVYCILNVVGYPILGYLWVFHRDFVDPLARKALQPSIKTAKEDLNVALTQKVLDLPSCQCHSPKTLEYQPMEGHCALATQRCILKSFQISNLEFYEAVGGGKSAVEMCDSLNSYEKISAKLVYGSEGYSAFRQALSLLNKDPENTRIAVNFLRGALFGFRGWRCFASSWIAAMFFGHFSVILGYLEKEDLVAVFDVNASYGLFLVPSRRLFDAVDTMDNTETRALIVVTRDGKKI